MTRILVRRLAAAGGALGIALAVAAGPAAASSAPPAPASQVTAVVHADDVHAPWHGHGRHGDVLLDVVRIVLGLLGGLL